VRVIFKIIGVVAGAVIVVGLYACLVAGKRADQQLERMWRKSNE